MRLHWSPKSPYVRKVMVCAHVLGLAQRMELVRSVAAMLKPNPTIMHDNPLSKIPTLILDDGSTLFDSVVICEYLNDLAQGTLFPQEPQAKWQALRWHALADGLLDALILWRNERDRPDGAKLQTLINAFDLKTRATLDLLESEAVAVAASPLSIGTISIGCALGYLDFRFDQLGWRASRPQLAQWFAHLEQSPSFVATQVVDG